MNDVNSIMELSKIDFVTSSISIFVFLIFTEITVKKIMNERIKIINCICNIIILGVVSVFIAKIKYFYNSDFIIIFQAICIIVINSFELKNKIANVIINTLLAISINYILYSAAVIICFVPMVILNIDSDYINLIWLTAIYIILIYAFFKIKRIKNGIIFLQKKLQNEYLNILVINISVLILFVINIISEYKEKFTAKMALIFIFLSIVMYVTIKELLNLYYKQNLLIQELKESKEENEKLKEDNARLEEENLSFNKKSHTLAHKQKSLERKIRKLMQNTEFAEEIGINDQIEKLSQELYQKPQNIELEKTGIENIDDMLGCMQEECIKNNIEFELKIYGNIYQMTNNYVTKDELEILIADHVKDAIIAINHSDNINRSILVRIGKIDGIYSLYIYDSGIEFEPETFKKLGKEPITTHADSGGTGLGFMNTFDTLKKNKASLIIKEYNKPCKENYTKVIIIKFDDKSEFKVDSYREKILNLDIEEKADGKNLSIEKEKEGLELSYVGDKKALEVSYEGRNGKNE
mgnify:CR=1 FL=1